MLNRIMLFLLIFSLSMTAFAAKMATCEGKYGNTFPFCCIDFSRAAYNKGCPAGNLTCWQFADGVTCHDAANATQGVISNTCTLTTPVNGNHFIFDSYCQKSESNPSGYKLTLRK